MRALIQRVKYCSIQIENTVVSKIESGLLILLGIGVDDSEADVHWLAPKVASLRIFDDAHGVMNESVVDKDYDIMVVSQFTLFASTKKGNRPSYLLSARPELAEPLYERFKAEIEKCSGCSMSSGVFGAHMEIELINDGPVTILIDSKDKM